LRWPFLFVEHERGGLPRAVNIERLYQWNLPTGTTILGGGEGLHREVSWVVLLRRTAPAFGRLRGGELALVPLAGLARLHPPVSLGELLGRLVEVGIAGVALQGEPPAGAGAIADRLGVPLLRVPDDAALPALEQELNRRLAEWQGELRHRSDQVYRQLMELALAHRGQPAIVERLSRILAKPVSLEDAGGRTITFATNNGAAPAEAALPALVAATQARVDAWAAEAALNAADPPVQRFDLAEGGLGRLVAPVVGGEGIAAWLSLWAPTPQIGTLEQLAVARGAAACAVEVAWGRAVDRARDQLRGDLADDLIRGVYGDERQAIERAARMGFDLEGPQVVLAAAVAPAGAGEIGRSLGKRVLWCDADGVLALVLPAPEGGGAALKALAGDWARELVGLGVGFLAGQAGGIGIGRAHAGPTGVGRGWREASEALALGRSLFGEGTATYFGDLGIYRFLLAAQDRGELRRFHDEYLGPLAEYDRKHNSELLATLGAYFRSGQSPTAAAALLHAHRNTVLYRLDRIAAISGRRLDDPETCLALHLALRVREVLRTDDKATGRQGDKASG
jgi:purine catabolism regulator